MESRTVRPDADVENKASSVMLSFDPQLAVNNTL
ncbi:hypothetical protein SLEP1_g58214 [Rubroshorea leprosula]|uniref:Uncharacterized protein n=1 Tax=Rubroshorea leprosula TaxID=152421 RepID=A0AAV5MP13_9ROSI|nr:hypothetical protein SLEP1_g58214 [Rubroshorea leprosula]